MKETLPSAVQTVTVTLSPEAVYPGMTLKLALAACLAFGAYAQTPDSLVAINYEVGTTVTTAPNTATASSVNAKASVMPRKTVKAHVRFHNNSQKIITYVGFALTHQYPDGTSETGHTGLGWEQETLNGLHLKEFFEPKTGRKGELFQPFTPTHEKSVDLDLKADKGIPTVIAKPELVIFEDRTWVGDQTLAQRVFSNRQRMSDEYNYVLGIVREAKASVNPVAVYQGYLDQWKANGWTAGSISHKALFPSNMVPMRIQQYMDAQNAGNEADLILLRSDEAEKSFYAEHARAVPPIPAAAKGAK
jgi:hypothetical protein